MGFDHWFARAAGRFVLDIEALKAGPARVVVAGKEFFPYRCAAALAGALNTTLEDFPGGHAGFVDHPGEFAARLKDVLADHA